MYCGHFCFVQFCTIGHFLPVFLWVLFVLYYFTPFSLHPVSILHKIYFFLSFFYFYYRSLSFLPLAPSFFFCFSISASFSLSLYPLHTEFNFFLAYSASHCLFILLSLLSYSLTLPLFVYKFSGFCLSFRFMYLSPLSFLFHSLFLSPSFSLPIFFTFYAPCSFLPLFFFSLYFSFLFLSLFISLYLLSLPFFPFFFLLSFYACLHFLTYLSVLFHSLLSFFLSLFFHSLCLILLPIFLSSLSFSFLSIFASFVRSFSLCILTHLHLLLFPVHLLSLFFAAVFLSFPLSRGDKETNIVGREREWGTGEKKS